MALPRPLGKLTKLTNSDMHWNRLEVLQPKIGVCVLSLRDNHLVILLQELAHTAELPVLDVPGNQLQRLLSWPTNLNLKAHGYLRPRMMPRPVRR